MDTHEHRGWKRTLDLPELGYKQLGYLIGCWNPNSGPLEEQQVFIITKPSLLSPTTQNLRRNAHFRAYGHVTVGNLTSSQDTG